MQLLRDSVEGSVTSPVNRNKLLEVLSPKSEPREQSKKKKVDDPKSGEEWRDMLVYVFSDSIFCAKKIRARNVRQFSNSLRDVFKGSGWHKFSALKSIKLTNAVVECDPVKPTTFYISGSGDGAVHEFQTETSQQRVLWVTHFKDTMAKVPSQ
jgi:hypothetical protein